MHLVSGWNGEGKDRCNSTGCILVLSTMVVGASPLPTGIPNLGCGEEGNFIQCEQLHGDTAWL